MARYPVKVVDDFIKKDEYFSRFLTYSITTEKAMHHTDDPAKHSSTSQSACANFDSTDFTSDSTCRSEKTAVDL
jgi:hypothetical protein